MIAIITLAGLVWVLLWTPFPDAERNKNLLFIGSNVPPTFRFIAILCGLFGGYLLLVLVG